MNRRPLGVNVMVNFSYDNNFKASDVSLISIYEK